MKIFHFCVLMISFCLLQAQRPYYRPNTHEISVQPLGFNLASLSDYSKTTVRILPIGVRYKYHFNATAAARGGIFYKHFNGTDIQTPSATLKMNYIEAKGGYERAFNIKKYQLFGGADAIGGFRETNSTAALRGTNVYYGFGGFVGIKRYFKENISLTVENDFYYIVHPKKTKEGATQGTYSEVGTNFLQVYLSIHFKRQFKTCACGKPGS